MSVNLRIQDTHTPCHTIALPLGRTIKQINQVATCHSLVLSISKLITSFNEDKRFVCSCLSALPVRLSAPRMQILYLLLAPSSLYKDTTCVYTSFVSDGLCFLILFLIYANI